MIPQIQCQYHSNHQLDLICIQHDCLQLGPLCSQCTHQKSHSLLRLDDYVKDLQISARLDSSLVPTCGQIKQNQLSVFQMLETFFNKIVQKYSQIQQTLSKEFKSLQSDNFIHSQLQYQRDQLISEISDGRVDHNKTLKLYLQEIITIQHNLISEKSRYNTYANMQQNLNKKINIVYEKFDQILATQKESENVEESCPSSPIKSSLPQQSLQRSIQGSVNFQSLSFLNKFSPVSKSNNDNFTTKPFSSQQKGTPQQQNKTPYKSNLVIHQNLLSEPTESKFLLDSQIYHDNRLVMNQQKAKDLDDSKLIESERFLIVKPRVTERVQKKSETFLYIKPQVMETVQKQSETPLYVKPQVAERTLKKSESLFIKPQVMEIKQKQTETSLQVEPKVTEIIQRQGETYLQVKPQVTETTPKKSESSQQIIPQTTDMISKKSETFLYLKPRQEMILKKKSTHQHSQSVIIPNPNNHRSHQVKRAYFPPTIIPINHQKIGEIVSEHRAIRFMFLIKGDQFASAGHDLTIQIWDRNNLQLIQTLEGHKGNILCLTYSEENQILASSALDNTIRLWDYNDNRFDNYVTLVGGHDDKVRCLIIYDDYLASGGDDTSIIIWSIKTGTILRKLTEINQGRISSFYTTDHHLIVGCNKTILLYNTSNYNDAKIMNAHDSLVVCLLVTQSDSTFLKNRESTKFFQQTESDNQSQSVKPILQESQSHTLLKRKSTLIGKPFEGHLLISGGRDLKIKLWNYKTHTLLYTINEEYVPTSIVHMKKENYLVFGLQGFDKQGKIMIWNINDEEHARMQGEICDSGSGVNAILLFEQENDTFLCASYENRVMEKYKLT